MDQRRQTTGFTLSPTDTDSSNTQINIKTMQCTEPQLFVQGQILHKTNTAVLERIGKKIKTYVYYWF